jgi:3-hydroxybutyryl-CoA dehydratase
VYLSNFENIQIGDGFSMEKTITSAMVQMFADFTGDLNPIHLDDEYCKARGLGSRSVHGLLTASFLSGFIGMHFPGEGSICLSHRIEFITPVRVGDTIRIAGRVVAKNNDNAFKLNIVTLKFEIRTQDGVLAAKCTSKVSV